MNKHPVVSVIIPTMNRLEKLIRLVESVESSDYDNVETIIVDDNSTTCNVDSILDKFPKLTIIHNDKENSMARCRNLGAKKSKGELLFFIDDDNVIDKKCISILVQEFKKNDKLGEGGPIMYFFNEPKKVWCAGARRHYLTGKTTYLGKGQIDTGQFSSIFSENFPNAFMVSQKAYEEAGGWNEVLFRFHSGESDVAKRISQKGYEIMLFPKAKVWHDLYDADFVKGTRITENRVYYYSRNRIIFQKLYPSKFRNVFFYIFFFVMVAPAYFLTLLMSGKPLKTKLDMLSSYLSGIKDGILFDKTT